MATKHEVLTTIDKKIKDYKHRIEIRQGNNYFDESGRIKEFKERISILEEAKEYIYMISEI